MVEAAQPQPEVPPPRERRLVPLLVVAGLMAVEGIGVFFLGKAISPEPAPAQAAGADHGSGAENAAVDLVEMELVECRPTNRLAGKFTVFHVRVSALVSPENQERAQSMVTAKRARLEDSVNTVIRSTDPKHFYEPGLETVKRRLKVEFDRLFGDDQLIKEVLVPHWLQSGSGI